MFTQSTGKKKVKRNFPLVFMALFAFSVYGKGKYFRSDELMFNFNYNSWEHSNSVVQTEDWPSVGFDFNWVMDFPLKKEGRFSIAFGLGYSVHRVHHNIDLRLNTSLLNHEGQFELKPLLGQYATNKLSSNFIELPVEFRFRTRTKIPFRLFAGFKGGYMIYHYNKYSNDAVSYKNMHVPYVNQWRYGPTFRIGYGIVNFYGFYSMNSIFKRGGTISEYAVGLTIMAN